MVHAYAEVKSLQAGCCGKVSFPDASGLSATKDTCWESVAVVLPLVIWGASLLDRTQVVVLHGPVHLANVSGLTDHILGMFGTCTHSSEIITDDVQRAAAPCLFLTFRNLQG